MKFEYWVLSLRRVVVSPWLNCLQNTHWIKDQPKLTINLKKNSNQSVYRFMLRV